MSAIEKLEAKTRELLADIATRTNEIQQLRDELKRLEDRRDDAIDSDDESKAEELTGEIQKLELKIATKLAICQRKAAQSAPRASVVEAWNIDRNKYQSMVNGAEKVLSEALYDVAEKALDLACIVADAGDARQAALELAGDPDPDKCTPGNIDFKPVSFTPCLVKREYVPSETLKQIRPDAFRIISKAMKQIQPKMQTSDER